MYSHAHCTAGEGHIGLMYVHYDPEENLVRITAEIYPLLNGKPVKVFTKSGHCPITEHIGLEEELKGEINSQENGTPKLTWGHFVVNPREIYSDSLPGDVVEFAKKKLEEHLGRPEIDVGH